MNRIPTSYGLLAEFETAWQLLEAVRRLRAEGYREIEAYSPFPVEGLSEALGYTRSRLPLLMLLGGLAAAVGSYFVQYYAAVIDYPINSGGRPDHSWPAFIPATVELTILGAVLAGVAGMLFFNGLPEFHHPLFNDPGFERASQDRFFLCIRSKDPLYHSNLTRRFLEELAPDSIREVER